MGRDLSKPYRYITICPSCHNIDELRYEAVDIGGVEDYLPCPECGGKGHFCNKCRKPIELDYGVDGRVTQMKCSCGHDREEY